MDIDLILPDVARFQSYAKPIDLTFNQYLVTGREPILVHTGDWALARELVDRAVPLLNGQPLAYVFISHFESDECGGLQVWLAKFPKAVPVCSEITARQLRGFGITESCLIRKPGEVLETGDARLQFVNYPSEMHLWSGLLAFETRRGTLFSSDLFIRFGAASRDPQALAWSREIGKITAQQVPSAQARGDLQKALLALPVRAVAPGHGPVLKAEP